MRTRHVHCVYAMCICKYYNIEMEAKYVKRKTAYYARCSSRRCTLNITYAVCYGMRAAIKKIKNIFTIVEAYYAEKHV